MQLRIRPGDFLKHLSEGRLVQIYGQISPQARRTNRRCEMTGGGRAEQRQPNRLEAVRNGPFKGGDDLFDGAAEAGYACEVVILVAKCPERPKLRVAWLERKCLADVRDEIASLGKPVSVHRTSMRIWSTRQRRAPRRVQRTPAAR
ncbi:hypothetical protein U1769_20885 [Sphingomonas sp. ZT3P38]|uniref:hypothetical protein n=1 Tax=Parasphingomonas zepuensis TaxID=3096161 RepID=UPI002FCA3E22